MRHLITLADLNAAEMETIFSISEDLKAKFAAGIREPLLPGRVLAMLFEKPSLRTRVSFEAGMIHLGGGAFFLSDEAGFGKRESPADFGRVLSEMVDVIVVRSRQHETVVELAKYSSCSVINGLTDSSHPCQTMADLFTLRELLGKLDGRTIAWVGDANNVTRSLAIGCGKLGVRLVAASPENYQFEDDYVKFLKQEVPELELELMTDPVEAVKDAAAVYTDVWVSMGQEHAEEERKQVFAAYQLHAEIMANAQKGTVFMHCLPARRGEEVTDDVIDSPQSIVVQQAGNRMHVQKGILAWLLGSKTRK